jgi:hypothetical protein
VTAGELLPWSESSHPAVPGSRPDRLAVFCAAWSAYLLLHQCLLYYLWFRFRSQDLAVGSVLVVLALATALRPRLWMLVALLLVHVAHAWRGMPNHANHVFLTLCINVTILLCIARHAIPQLWRRRLVRDALYREMSALVRLELIVLYFFVVLHKLNWDYLNPSVSCGAQLWLDMARKVPILPAGDWTRWPCLLGALAAEMAIPVLLCIRRTRLAGIGLGMLFHAMLTLHPNLFIYSFSAMLYALYTLFLPPDVLDMMMRRWESSRFRRAVASIATVWGIGAIIVMCILLAGMAYGLVKARIVTRHVLIDDYFHEIVPVLVRCAWYASAIALCWLYFSTLWRLRQARDTETHPVQTDPIFAPALSTPLIVMPLLVFLNGFCPYLGLKTESSFAMFANIRTEGGRNNHLFMPFIPLAGYQTDIVQVISSTDGELRSLAERNRGLIYVEFRRELSKRTSPKFEVRFIRNGVERTLNRGTDASDEAFRKLPFIERKLLHFRPVQLDDQPQRCGH